MKLLVEEDQVNRRETIKKELSRIVCEFGLIEDTEKDVWINFGDLDSIQIISVIVEIEECFKIEIPDEYLVAEFFENDEHVIDVISELIETNNKTPK